MNSQSFQYLSTTSDIIDKKLQFPLTELQEAYWLGSKDFFDLSSSAFSYVEIKINDQIAPEKLKESLIQCLKNHEMLRAVITPEGTQIVLNEISDFKIDYNDLSSLPPEQANQNLKLIREKINVLPIIPSHMLISYICYQKIKFV